MLFFLPGECRFENHSIMLNMILNITYRLIYCPSFNTSVVWTALLSAWYPPEEEVEVSEEKKD